MPDIRWQQRHVNYSKMLDILKKELNKKEIENFSELEKIGLSKTFELCFELLWKLLKDYLEYEKIEIGLMSPKNILKEAAEKGLLQQIDVNGDILIKSHKTRNDLVHVYDKEKFFDALVDVKNLFLSEMIKVDDFFKKLVLENE